MVAADPGGSGRRDGEHLPGGTTSIGGRKKKLGVRIFIPIIQIRNMRLELPVVVQGLGIYLPMQGT